MVNFIVELIFGSTSDIGNTFGTVYEKNPELGEEPEFQDCSFTNIKKQCFYYHRRNGIL